MDGDIDGFINSYLRWIKTIKILKYFWKYLYLYVKIKGKKFNNERIDKDVCWL